jgi:protochlorophyllide reductase
MQELVNSGDYYVLAANRNVAKMESVAEREGFDPSSYKVMECDLASFDSTRKFCANVKKIKGTRGLDRLVCNAAVYQPANLEDQDEKGVGRPRITADGHEEQLQINHLSHFLMCNILLPELKKAKNARLILVGSITGNDNTVGGGAVYPVADLGDLQGLAAGGKFPNTMIDGGAFNGAKAYKDAKVCNMMTCAELDRRYHKDTGIVFSTMYPGCIAETQLFREKRGWFRKLFPVFMKYVTGGYVSEEEAGERLFACIDAAETATASGKYWGWNGGAKTVGYIDFSAGTGGKPRGAGGSGGSLQPLDFSDKVRDPIKSKAMFEYSTEIVGAKW